MTAELFVVSLDDSNANFLIAYTWDGGSYVEHAIGCDGIPTVSAILNLREGDEYQGPIQLHIVKGAQTKLIDIPAGELGFGEGVKQDVDS